MNVPKDYPFVSLFRESRCASTHCLWRSADSAGPAERTRGWDIAANVKGARGPDTDEIGDKVLRSAAPPPLASEDN
jgi:hypothetical protein